MIIEQIRSKDGETIIVELEDKRKLYLSIEVVFKNGLRKGDNLDEDLFNYLIKENQKYFLRKKGLDLLARRAHSSFELKIKLMQRKYERELIDELINELLSKNILNDKDFALQYAIERITIRKIGKQKLRAELIKKGIHQDIISEVIDSLDMAEDFENALLLARKKMKSLQNRKTEKKKSVQKIISYLLTKGYEYETAKIVVKRLDISELEE
jgi:regulatory protein